MAGKWTPALRVSETAGGCRLTLEGVSYGTGATLQEAGEDLVRRLARLAAGLRENGFRISSELPPPDRRILELLWEIGELAARGDDVRDRVLGPTGP